MSCQRCGKHWTMKVSSWRKYCAPCRRIKDRQLTDAYRAKHPRTRTYARQAPKKFYPQPKLHKIICTKVMP